MFPLVLIALIQAAGSDPEPVDAERVVAVFERFCVRTGADRSRFDAAIAEAPELVKISRPSMFSGVEFNRTWTLGRIHLAFLDAPPPSGRSCSVSAGGFTSDGSPFAERISDLTGVSLVRDGDRGPYLTRWIGTASDGTVVVVSYRSRPGSRIGGVEIMLRPAEAAAGQPVSSG